jgi:hypothetical protein
MLPFMQTLLELGQASAAATAARTTPVGVEVMVAVEVVVGVAVVLGIPTVDIVAAGVAVLERGLVAASATAAAGLPVAVALADRSTLLFALAPETFF